MFGKFLKVAKHLPNIFKILLDIILFHSTSLKPLLTLVCVEFIGVVVHYCSVFGSCEKVPNCMLRRVGSSPIIRTETLTRNSQVFLF